MARIIKEYQLFKSLISKNDIGKKSKDGSVFRLNNKEKISRVINQRNKNKKAGKKEKDREQLASLSNKNIVAHIAGQEVFYYSGNDYIESAHNLFPLMLDIDNHHGKGMKSEGIRLAEDLKSQLFPNMHIEDSTNGNGTHGYILVDRFTFSGKSVSEICKTIEAALSVFAKSYNIQKIEVKGNPGWTEWNNNVCTFHCGTLAKIPFGLDTESFHNTTRTTITDLRDWAEAYLESNSTPAEVVEINKDGIKFGSNAIVSRELQEGVKHNGYLHKFGQRTLPLVDWSKKSNRTKITADTIAYTLLVLNLLSKDMNKDGSLPVARVKGVWNWLADNNIISGRYDGSKFAAIRNMLSENGFIDWKDHNYSPAASEGEKGQACKWKLNTRIMEFIDGNIGINAVFSSCISIKSTCVEQENNKTKKKFLLPTLVFKKQSNPYEYIIPAEELWDIMTLAA